MVEAHVESLCTVLHDNSEHWKPRLAALEELWIRDNQIADLAALQALLLARGAQGSAALGAAVARSPRECL